MKTIAINAINSSSGGGRSIRDSFLRLLDKQDLKNRHVVLAPPGGGLEFISNPQITILELPRWCARTSMAPLVYRFVLGRVLKHIGAQVVFNLGDLIIHTAARQLYLFDWSYALKVHPKVWQGMTPLDRLVRKTKLHLLEKDFHRPDIVIAQTDVIKGILQEKYGLRNIRVIGNAVTIPETKPDSSKVDFGLPKGVRLLYPALYYPHKNHEILLDVAEHIKARGKDYRIIVTVNPDTKAAADFIAQISAREVQDVLHNIGQVRLDDIPALYRQCDALLMPTLLESFSIVYPEAMHFGLPVLTSDMWFAHAVCGKAARYFDPLDAQDILDAIEDIMSSPKRQKDLIEAGKRQLASFPDWDENFQHFMDMLQELADLPVR